MLPFKMLLLPVRLLFGTARVSAKAGYKTARTGAVVGAKTAKGSAKAGYNAGRVVGYGRTAVFATGIGVGILVASPQARAAAGRFGSTIWGLRRRAEGPSDGEVADKIRRRLAGAQATWHLDQPNVTVKDGLVRLDGAAPDDDSRRMMGETAAAVDGVREVDNRVVVSDPAAADDGTSSGHRTNGSGATVASAPGDAA